MKSLVFKASTNQLRGNIYRVQKVLVAANYLRMEKLKLFCEDFMFIDKANVFGFYDFVHF